MGKSLTILSKSVKPLAPIVEPFEAPKVTGQSRIPDSEIYPSEEPRIITSPFQIDHRGEFIRELEDDAKILVSEAEAHEEEAKRKRAWADSLIVAASHMKIHAPE